MKGTIKDVMYSSVRNETLVDIRLDGNVIGEINKYKGFHIDLSLKRFFKKRSLERNRYYWTLRDKLAYALAMPKTEIYISHIKEIGGNSYVGRFMESDVPQMCRNWRRNGLGWVTEIFPSKLNGCTNIVFYKGSSVYDTRQMSRLIDLRVQDCKALGIETKSPEQIRALLEGWERNDVV